MAELSKAGWEGGCHQGNFTTAHCSLGLNCRFFSSLKFAHKTEGAIMRCVFMKGIVIFTPEFKIMQQLQVILDEYLTSAPC